MTSKAVLSNSVHVSVHHNPTTQRSRRQRSELYIPGETDLSVSTCIGKFAMECIIKL